MHSIPAHNRHLCFSSSHVTLACSPNSRVGGLVLVQVGSGGETAWRLGFITGRPTVGGAQAFSGISLFKTKPYNLHSLIFSHLTTCHERAFFIFWKSKLKILFMTVCSVCNSLKKSFRNV